MGPDQITEMVVATIAGIALVAAAGIKLYTRKAEESPKTEEQVQQENQIYAKTPTPVSPGGDSEGIVALSKALTEVGKKYDALEGRFRLMESKFLLLEHSYPLLYGWAVQHTDNWAEIRLRETPLPLPHGVYHPEFINQQRR